jgi:hypothetical protein
MPTPLRPPYPILANLTLDAGSDFPPVRQSLIEQWKKKRGACNDGVEKHASTIRGAKTVNLECLC